MRHRRRGRKLGRAPSHQRALLHSLATAIFLTERDAEFDDNKPKVKGRIITTVAKAKEVRPLVEKCITTARRGVVAEDAAADILDRRRSRQRCLEVMAHSDHLAPLKGAIAPAVAPRRRCLKLLGNKQAVRVLFDEVRPRFSIGRADTRASSGWPSRALGDAGTRVILEFVGVRDRAAERSVRPTFEADVSPGAASPKSSQWLPSKLSRILSELQPTAQARFRDKSLLALRASIFRRSSNSLH